MASTKRIKDLVENTSVSDNDVFVIDDISSDTTNKITMATITSTVTNSSEFDTAVNNNTNVAANTDNRHTHSNKTILDNTEESFTTVLKNDLNLNTTNRHTHSNKTILDNTEESFTTILKTKLDGIENGADVTDAINVDAAGATMNTDTDVSGNSWVLDEDDMASNSNTKVPTQQSVKAYVDSHSGNSYDQDLNTTDSVSFEEVTINGGTLYLDNNDDTAAYIKYSPITTNTYLKLYKTGNMYLHPGGKDALGVWTNKVVVNPSGDGIDFDVVDNSSGASFLFADVSESKVGIGTTSPTEKLEVIGTVKATAFEGDGSALTGISGGASDTINVEDLTADKTLVAGTDKTVQYLNPNGSNRTITLSTTDANEGDKFTIVNTSTANYTLLVYNDTSIISSVNSGTSYIYYFDGTDWRPTSDIYFQKVNIGFETFSDYYSVAVGPNTTSYDSGVAIGYYSNVSNVTSGNPGYGVAIGVFSDTNNTYSSTAIGFKAKAERSGEFINSFAHYFDDIRNYSIIGLYGSTTDATQTEIYCAGVSNQRLNIIENSVLSFKAQVTGVDTTSGDVAVYHFSGAIKNIGGTTAIVGTVTKTVVAEDDSSWDCTIEADDTNDALVIKVTGDASNTVKWTARIDTVETRY